MALRIALIIGIGFGIGFGALYGRLVYSPITMSFLVPPIEKAVNRTLSGFHFDIGDAVLRRSDSGFGIEFRLTDVRLIDDDNNPVVESPLASADVSLKALLSGRLAAGQVDLIGPRLFLQYSDERGIALSFADPRDLKGDLAGAKRELTGRQPFGGALGGQKAEQGQQPQGVIGSARGRAVNLTHALNDIFAATRKGESAYLTSFGIRDAAIFFDRGDQITRWLIPSVDIELDHSGRNSAVSGNLFVQAPTESFQVQFRAEQNRRTSRYSLSLGVDDVVPRAFSTEFPALKLPKMWNMPVSLFADLDLGGNGDILGATIRAKLKQGEFYAPWDQRHSATIDGGDLRLVYSREQGVIQLTQSDIHWGNSHLKLRGVMQRQRDTGHWTFQFGTDEIALGAEQFGIPVIPLDRMIAQGDYNPKEGDLRLDRLFLQAADAQILLSGRVTQGHDSPAIELNGQISSMPVAFFKLIWPKFVAYGAREWIGLRVPTGRITGGSVKVDIPADMLATLASGGHLPPEAVDLKLDLEELQVRYVKNLPMMHIPSATATLAGQRFFFNVPKSDMTLPSGSVVNFTDGQFIIGDLRPHFPQGEVHFKSEADAASVMELLDQPELGYISALHMPVPKVDAKVDTAFSISMPLIANLKFKDMTLKGRSEVADIRATGLPGGFGVHGGTLDFDVSEKALEAHGELKVNGLPVLVGWQRIYDAPIDRQPPLRLRTVLDEKSREEFGLKINHVLRGGAPTELTVNFRKQHPPNLHFEVNLTEADIVMASLGWRKPPGQRAVLTFDAEPADDSGMELKNVNLLGDDLTVRGWVRTDEKRQPVAFNFPTVALNLQTQLAIGGELNSNNIWKVRVKGPSYDGRQFFRSLFSAGEIAENQPQLPKDSPGMDVDVAIDTVIGFFDTTLKNVKIAAQRRNNRLSSLDLLGQLNGRSPLAARIQGKRNEPRQILAEATDAGSAFRLVGFYPSVRGGDVSLKVDLDGTGATEKVGVLYARNFVIANDQVVEEVLSGPKDHRPQTQQAAYDQLQFDRMRVPFSVGNGQFLLHDAAINGPLLGATMRGSIDFKRERVNLSGTYVPFYGINGAIGLVPILGDLLISRNGEGLFGITFAIKGSNGHPNVLVNPMSMVAPGFLRQLFEFDQGQPSLLPPDEHRDARAGGATQSSSEPPITR